MNKSKNDNNAHSWHTERLEDKDKKERHNDHRSPYDLDKTRVVHSFPFRRWDILKFLAVFFWSN